MELMTVRDDAVFPLQGELSRRCFWENNHLYLKNIFLEKL